MLQLQKVYGMFNMFNITHRGLSHFYSSRSNMTSIIEKIPTLYGDEASPPVRFVLMTASALNIKLDYHGIDLFSGEQNTEFYKKINPLQKVPALVVQGQVIRDSHAIGMYLCQQHDHSNTLYSTDALTKAKIDEMLFFNSGTLFPIDSAIFNDFFSRKWPVDQIKLDKLNSALEHLDSHLSKSSWLTGDEMRLCDICLMATVTSVYQIVQGLRKHNNIHKWLMKFEPMPFYAINRRGIERLTKYVNLV